MRHLQEGSKTWIRRAEKRFGGVGRGGRRVCNEILSHSSSGCLVLGVVRRAHHDEG